MSRSSSPLALDPAHLIPADKPGVTILRMMYVFAVVLTLVGYSGGAVVSARSRSRLPEPQFADNLLIGLFAVAAIYFLREGVPFRQWAITWMLFMAIAGFVSERVLHVTSPLHGEFTAPRTSAAAQSMWKRWRSFTAQSVDFQARILIALIYFILLWPFAYFARQHDPMRAHAANSVSSWVPRMPACEDIAGTRRQF